MYSWVKNRFSALRFVPVTVIICMFYHSFQIGESPVDFCLLMFFHYCSLPAMFRKNVSVQQLDRWYYTDGGAVCAVTVETGSGGGPGNPDWGKGAAVVGWPLSNALTVPQYSNFHLPLTTHSIGYWVTTHFMLVDWFNDTVRLFGNLVFFNVFGDVPSVYRFCLFHIFHFDRRGI